MNAPRNLLLIALFAALSLGAMGCTIAATPHHANLSVAASTGPTTTTHVVHHTAPTRVYHEGRWLHYRSDGYYYRTGSRWVVAHHVPSHVVSYHRPGRPVHVTTSSHRPTHVRRTVRPTSSRGYVRTSRPTHVQRTTGPRRTYYRR